MLLGIDIGNTAISISRISSQRISSVAQLDTAMGGKTLTTNIARVLREESSRRGKALRDVVICSVVPKTTRICASAVKSTLGLDPIVIGRNLKVPIKNNYRDPKQVGQDRLLGAYAARELYGKPAIIIDFGTAITFDIVNSRGAYDGGMIIPGVKMSFDSLYQKTALLPAVKKLNQPKTIIGRETKSSILSGIYYGYGTMCQGLIVLLKKRMRKTPKVIMTGGFTPFMKGFLKGQNVIDDSQLVFKGMRLMMSDMH